MISGHVMGSKKKKTNYVPYGKTFINKNEELFLEKEFYKLNLFRFQVM